MRYMTIYIYEVDKSDRNIQTMILNFLVLSSKFISYKYTKKYMDWESWWVINVIVYFFKI